MFAWFVGDIQEVIAILEDWFLAIENGTASKRLPDPLGKRYDKDAVNIFIESIEGVFTFELAHHASYHDEIGIRTRGKGMTNPPDFNRLIGASREAFMQAIIAKRDEVQKRVNTRYNARSDELEDETESYPNDYTEIDEDNSFDPEEG
jgi:hypothetical protein